MHRKSNLSDESGEHHINVLSLISVDEFSWVTMGKNFPVGHAVLDHMRAVKLAL